MRDQLKVRKLRTEDVGVLGEHFRSEVDRTHHSDQDAGHFSFHVAWAGDLPVGHALIRWIGARIPEVALQYPGCPEIYRLVVLEPYRARGIGSQLIAACEGEARARRKGLVGLGVEHANLQARRLYERLGYSAAISRYEDSYAVRDAVGEISWVCPACVWMTKALGDDRDHRPR
ncbi:MAG TPA: GNAT family N-acetyltransferase [Polyangiaceae bacterium]|nr:GNAT family N-acetyltransferase [Polyangiaceae bacterium]